MLTDEGVARPLADLRAQLVHTLSTDTITHGLARTLRAALKEVEAATNHLQSTLTWPGRIAEDAFKRVQIGGGNHLIEDFFNIDIAPPADLLWDVREGIPLPDGTVEFVFSEHFLEHIDYPRSAILVVREIHRVLAAGGQAVTGVPDAGLVLAGYPDHPRLSTTMQERWYANRDCLGHINTYLDLVNYVFRDQDDDPIYNPHYWAYDYAKLVSLFTEAGFTNVEKWPFDPTIANPKREWGSVYVVATK